MQISVEFKATWRSLTRGGADCHLRRLPLAAKSGTFPAKSRSLMERLSRKSDMRDTDTEIYSYGSIQRDFHWLMAAVILTAICVGIYAADLPKEDATRGLWFGIHKSLGMTVFFLAIMRIGWRLFHGTPRYRVALGRFTALAAWVAHSALYILMVGVPIGGYVLSTASGHPVSWFGLYYLSERGPCRQIPGQARRRRSCHRRPDFGHGDRAAYRGGDLASLVQARRSHGAHGAPDLARNTRQKV